MRFGLPLFSLICLSCFSVLAADTPAGLATRAWESAPEWSAARVEGAPISALPPVEASEAGSFQTSEDGTRYLTLRFKTPEAAAVRLHLRDMHLAAGAKIFIYGVDNGAVTDVAGPYTGAGNSIDADLWTAAVRGSEAVLEFQQGDIDSGDLPFVVAEIAAASAAEVDAEPRSAARELRTSMFRGMPVTHEVVSGLGIFEGDIVLGESWELPPAAASKGVSRSALAITGSRYRWPGGVIPYSIDPTMPNQARITDAVAHWNNTMAGTIRLVLRTNEAAYVYFYRSPSAGQCASSVGMLGYGQYLYVGDYCGTGNVIHEIGHAVGLWHEQGREDRNTYVKINTANIDPSAAYNFNQNISNGDDVNAYDYGSIMHYSAYAFSMNGLPTIETIPAGIGIGQRAGLSPGDIAGVKSLYPGTVVTPPPSTPTPVAISINANPTGMPLYADSVQYTSATTLNWLPGSAHVVAAGTPPAAAGTRYTFQSWSDGGAQTHIVVTPTTPTTLKATYNTSYQVRTAVTGSGTLSVTPASTDSYYSPGTSLALSATPSAGSCFTGWTGLIAGTPGVTTLSVTKPYEVTAKFAAATFTASPAVVNASGNGGSYAVSVTATAGCIWGYSSTATWLRLRSTLPASGSGVVSLAADPNNTGVARTATITLGSAQITITQKPK